MEHTFYLLVKVTVKSDLSKEDAMEDFENNTEYHFGSTSACDVADTEIVEARKKYEDF